MSVPSGLENSLVGFEYNLPSSPCIYHIHLLAVCRLRLLAAEHHLRAPVPFGPHQS